jgi:hypothetical protein
VEGLSIIGLFLEGLILVDENLGNLADFCQK